MKPIRSSFLALLALRCPRCHQGPLFSYPTHRITKFSQMHEACPVCGQVYEPEPGFYWGAMFVSYAFSVAIFAMSGVVLYYLAGDPPVWVYILTVAIVTVLSMPLVFRYSRALMLYLFGFIRYNPRWAEKTQSQQPL